MSNSMFHFQKCILVVVLTTRCCSCSCATKNQCLRFSPDESIRNISNYHFIHLDWSKILPDGFTHRINQTEVNNYKNTIDALLLHHVQPMVSLFSGNLPPMFIPLGGWTNPTMVSYFAHYSRTVFKIFGERVKTWVTFFEPRGICNSFQGLKGDEFPSGTGEYACAYNILKAHAAAYHIYDKEFRIVQKGRISITLDLEWMLPEDVSNLRHVRAAEQRMQFQLGLYANPILNFGYSPKVVNRVAKKSKIEGFANSRLPEFSYGEKLQISGAFDFMQISYKGSFLIKEDQNGSHGKPTVNADSGGKIQKKVTWTKEKSEALSGLLLQWVQMNYQDAEVVIRSDNCYF